MDSSLLIAVSVLAFLLLVACNPPPAPKHKTPPPAVAEAVAEAQQHAPSPESEAAAVAKSFFDLLAAGRFDDARALWREETSQRKAPSDRLKTQAAAFQGAALAGEPTVEGAAGSSYADVRFATPGGPEDEVRKGTLRLERCNDVPGCTEEQKAWRIVELRWDR
jgi:hypothetical protein